jgi:hypothetical protein
MGEERESALRHLEEWAAEFSKEGRTLWEEIQRAYLSFLESGLDADEAARRWTLVVHLVNNFKNERRIKLPSTDWPTGPPDSEGTEIPTTWPRSMSGPQAAILDRLDEGFLAGRGFGWPKRSTLLSLVRPEEHAIIDRWTFTSLAGSTGGESPVLRLRTPLGERYPDGEKTPIPRRFSDDDYNQYVGSLKEVRNLGGRSLETCQRAFYMVGRQLRSADRTWGEYREDLRIKLIGS